MLFKKFYRIDKWINEGSGLIVKLIESQCINVSTYRALRSSQKGLINIKKRSKCSLWCHVRHINPVDIHPERITQNDKKLANDLDYDRVGFPLREKDFALTAFPLMCFL